MAYVLSIKNREGEYSYYPVEVEVYKYVRQLEAYIRNPEQSRLKTVYADRFGGNNDNTNL